MLSSYPPLNLSGNLFVVANDLGLFTGLEGASPVWKWDGERWINTRDCCSTCDPPPCEWVNAIVGTRGAVFLGGYNLQPWSSQNVLKWDGSNWTTLGTGVNGWVQALASNGSELFVGGYFTTAGGKPSRRFGIWHIPSTLKVRRHRDELVISWPKADTNLTLEVAANLRDGDWVEVNARPVLVANRLTITNETTQGSQFFRLRQK